MLRKEMGEKGITLVSLVITVVIMAIIILVVAKTTTDQELIDTTQNVTEEYDEATLFETLNTILVSERSLYDDGFVTKQEMWENIIKSIDSELNKELSETVIINEETENNQITGLTIVAGEKTYEMNMNKVTEKTEK